MQEHTRPPTTRGSTPIRTNTGSKQDPVFVEIARIRVPFDDVFDVVFKVIASLVIIGIALGALGGALWLLADVL